MVGGKVGASDPTNLAYLAHVEKLIAELGVADRVQWTGFTAERSGLGQSAGVRLRRAALS